MTQIFNQSDALEKRRVLRQSDVPCEALLWEELRRQRRCSAKFRRQYSVHYFVLDFYCPEVRLAIEIDGVTHDSDEAKIYDAERQSRIEELGITFLRFSNFRIQTDLPAVLLEIEGCIVDLRTKNAGRTAVWKRRLENGN